MLMGLKPFHFAGETPLVDDGVDAFTKTLLHFDGRQLQSYFIDSATPSRTWTRNGGGTLTSSVNAFGGQSYYNGSSSDWLDTPAHADFNVGSGDWTIDFWFYATGGAGTYRHAMGQCDASVSTASVSFYMRLDDTNKFTAITVIGASGYGISSIGTPSLNAWHHVAFVRAGDLLYLFLDGASQGVVGLPAGGAVVASANKMAIGRLGEWVSTGMGWMGAIDEFRFSKGIARWTTDFIPPSREYGYPGNDSNTKLLMNLSMPNIAEGGLWDFSPQQRGYATPFGAPVVGAPGGPCANGFLAMSGTSYITWPDHADWNLGSGDFTMDWWEYRVDANDSRPVFVRGGAVNYTYQPFLIGYPEGGVNKAYASNNGTSWNVLNSMPMGSIVVNAWTHFALVRKGNTFTSYKNGVAQGTVTTTEAMGSQLSAPLTIGYWNFSTGFYFNGYLSGLRIVKGKAWWTKNFTLPVTPYAAPNFAGGTQQPVSGNDSYTKLLLHFDGNLNDSSPTAKGAATAGANASLVADPKFGSQALSVANSNAGYIYYPTHADFDFGNGDFTIDCWIKYNNFTNSNQIISRDNTNYAPWLFGYNAAGSGAILFYASSSSGTWDIANAQPMGTMSVGVWNHLAVTRQGNTFRTFANGYKQAEWTHAGTIYAGGTLMIGGRVSAMINAVIDEVRISKGIARWTADFTAPTAPYG